MKSNNNKSYIWLAISLLAVIVIVWAGAVIVNRSSTPSVDTSKPASLSLLGSSLNTAAVGELSNIRWTSSNYGAQNVSVNLIRKVSDNPASYKLVRVIAASTPDDGSVAWTPLATDAGANTYVQIGCAASAQACTASAIN